MEPFLWRYLSLATFEVVAEVLDKSMRHTNSQRRTGIDSEMEPFLLQCASLATFEVVVEMLDMCKGSRQNREDMTRIDRLDDDQEELRATCYGSRVP